MLGNRNSRAVDYTALEDNALAARLQDGDQEAFRHIMKRCNQRLFRVARGIKFPPGLQLL